MPFPGSGGVDRGGTARAPGQPGGPGRAHPAVVGAAVAAHLVVFPAGAVLSEYLGTGTQGYVAAALAGVACGVAAAAAGAWLAARSPDGRRAGAGPGLVAGAAAVLAVALAYRLLPGGGDPLPSSGAAWLTYLLALAGGVVAAIAWGGAERVPVTGSR